jgi:flagellar biosynthesis/type III secretory pathway chaperone
MQTAENKTVDGNVEELLDRLISVIGSEAALFERFLELMERQQQALIAGDARDVKAVTAQLQQIAAQSQQLESQRIDIVEQIRLAQGTESDLNVSRICDMVDSARSNQLRAFRDTILGLYGRIEETRMRNGLLIEQSLEQIQHTMETIGRVSAKNDMYRPQGGISREYGRLGLDRRV